MELKINLLCPKYPNKISTNYDMLHKTFMEICFMNWVLSVKEVCIEVMLITQRLSLHVVSCLWRPFWSIMAWTAKHTFTSVLTRLQNEGVLRMVEDKWFSVFMMCPSRTWPMAFCYSVSFFPVLSLLFADPTIILEGIEKTRGVFCSFLVFLFFINILCSVFFSDEVLCRHTV